MQHIDLHLLNTAQSGSASRCFMNTKKSELLAKGIFKKMNVISSPQIFGSYLVYKGKLCFFTLIRYFAHFKQIGVVNILEISLFLGFRCYQNISWRKKKKSFDGSKIGIKLTNFKIFLKLSKTEVSYFFI